MKKILSLFVMLFAFSTIYADNTIIDPENTNIQHDDIDFRDKIDTNNVNDPINNNVNNLYNRDIEIRARANMDDSSDVDKNIHHR